ncbi:MAG: hypothetical protein ACRCYX_00485 [Dermatophilaceae bacterium]
MKLIASVVHDTPMFDGEHLVSDAGLVPVMALAEQAGLSPLIGQRVKLAATWVVSAGVNPVGRSPRSSLDGLGGRAHLVIRAERTELLPGIRQQAFIDTLLRPVFGHVKQGASFGHTKSLSTSAPQRALVVGDHDQHLPSGPRSV